ncbi:MAG: GTP cyclohydrolase I [Bacteroidota bacterium]
MQLSSHTPQDKKTGLAIHDFYKALDTQERESILDEATKAFGQFLTALKIDWQADAQTKQTPSRVAKMYVDEWLSGRFYQKPDMKFFPCTTPTQKTIIQGPITFSSLCPHHLIPFVGFVSLLISSDAKKVLGISKYARLVRFYSSKAYMQEDLGDVLLTNLMQVTQAQKVGVFISAKHRCCTHRGVNQVLQTSTTLHMSKAFELDSELRQYFTHITQKHMQAMIC